MIPLKLAYFGSPDFSARHLEKLINDKSLPIEVKLVVTQPDRPVGRKQVMTESPVKVIANKYQLITATGDARGRVPDSLERSKPWREGNSWQNLLHDIDFALVYAYGQIISKELLNLPKYGFICIHPSLLPAYRGTSPTTYPLILGDKITGVSLIKMNEKIDKGPILAQEKLKILPDEKRPELELRLTDLAFEMLRRVIPNLFRDPINNKEMLKLIQHDKTIIPSYAPLLTKDDGYISLSTLKKVLNNEELSLDELPNVVKKYFARNTSASFENWKLKIGNSSKTIFNCFRGLFSWPGLWTYIIINSEKKRLKIIDLKLDNLITLRLVSVQLEGKKEVDFKTFNKAYKMI